MFSQEGLDELIQQIEETQTGRRHTSLPCPHMFFVKHFWLSVKRRCATLWVWGLNVYDTAKKIMAVGLAGEAPFDWCEVCRLADLPSFKVLEEVRALRQEVENELR